MGRGEFLGFLTVTCDGLLTQPGGEAIFLSPSSTYRQTEKSKNRKKNKKQNKNIQKQKLNDKLSG